MKFTSTIVGLVLALAGSARAQDIDAIAAAIQTVADDITQFDTDVLAYTGGAPTTIQSDSDTIVSDTKLAITAVTSSPVLTDAQVEVILPAILALNTTINQAITDLISKKDPLVAACAGAQTLDDLNQQLTTATDLANGLTAITPPDLATVAPELSAPILAAINGGIAAFSDVTPCTSTTTSTTAPPTSTATSSSSASSSSPPDTTTSSTGPGSGSNSTYPTSSPSVPVYPTSSPPSYPTGTGSGSSSPATSTPCPPGSSSPAGSPPPYQTGSGGSVPPYQTGSGGNGGNGGSGGSPPPYQTGSGGNGGNGGNGGSGSGGNSGSTTSTPGLITNGASSARVGGVAGVVLAGVIAVMAL